MVAWRRLQPQPKTFSRRGVPRISDLDPRIPIGSTPESLSPPRSWIATGGQRSTRNDAYRALLAATASVHLIALVMLRPVSRARMTGGSSWARDTMAPVRAGAATHQ